MRTIFKTGLTVVALTLAGAAFGQTSPAGQQSVRPSKGEVKAKPSSGAKAKKAKVSQSTPAAPKTFVRKNEEY